MSTSNTSNIQAQRNNRLQKMDELKANNFDPFPVTSHRDFEIGFVKFWFDLIHKFDLSKLQSDETNFLLEHYLYQAMFPPTLVETFEEKIQMRHTVRQMGMDPDKDIDTADVDYDENLVQEIRSLLPSLQDKNKAEKEDLFYALVVDKAELEGSESTGESVDLSIKSKQNITLAGRVKTIRTSGKIAFVILEDESCPSGIQLIFKKDLLNLDITQKLEMAFSPENLKLQLGVE
jgi:lysyl-tRNA synthetase class II